MAAAGQAFRLILASASPRRRELLAQAGYVFTVEAADVDESEREGEEPGAYVLRLAEEKALAILARHTQGSGAPFMTASSSCVGYSVGVPCLASETWVPLPPRSSRRLRTPSHPHITANTTNPTVHHSRCIASVMCGSTTSGYAASASSDPAFDSANNRYGTPPPSRLAHHTCSSGLVELSIRNGSPIVAPSMPKIVDTGWSDTEELNSTSIPIDLTMIENAHCITSAVTAAPSSSRCTRILPRRTIQCAYRYPSSSTA